MAFALLRVSSRLTYMGLVERNSRAAAVNCLAGHHQQLNNLEQNYTNLMVNTFYFFLRVLRKKEEKRQK